MQVSCRNDVKIYNLSTGKSLPEWLSDRKKRLLRKKDVDLRRSIQLFQDFEMPAVSNQVKLSKDGQYVLATGIYKPRVRCYDVNQLSMKFERCFDSEVVKFEMLNDDYSKIIFLQCDRYVEFHAAYGRYYRTRIPKFGRDMSYHYPTCDLYLVGDSPEIYRLNLEQGRFLSSFQSDARSVNVCGINEQHHLLLCGTEEGRVEAWDPRVRQRVGTLDCALSSVTEESELKGIPSITALAFKGSLTLAVGTATGQILLFDIRSPKPLFVKDHMYGLAIKDIVFHQNQDLVTSMDKKIVKIWEQNTGQLFTSIQPSFDMNNLCVIPNTGMFLIANENPKILTYYIPSLGPAPRWCSFLDNLTEELEEMNQNTVYDDYRFVTKKELEDLGLSHIVGTNLLRAYMHGYFMDIRLYNKAKAIADPFAYEEYRKKKIKEKLEQSRENRVKVQKLPKVNRELAKKLLLDKESVKTKKKLPNLMEDSRFNMMFENPDFQVVESSEEYRLLHPLVSKIERAQKKLASKAKVSDQFTLLENDSQPNEAGTSDEEDSSDDDRAWVEEVKRQHKLLKYEARMKQREADEKALLEPRFYEIKEGALFSGFNAEAKDIKSLSKLSLEDRLHKSEAEGTFGENVKAIGNQTLTFQSKQSNTIRKRQEELKQHLKERKKTGRSTRMLKSKNSSRFKRKNQGI